jgi:hypothetical protein
MPGSIGTTFRDLLGKLDMLVVECPKCSRTGRYAVRRLIAQRGGECQGLARSTAKRQAAIVRAENHKPNRNFEVRRGKQMIKRLLSTVAFVAAT